MAKGYQGHKSYNAWNVCLWVNNTEHLYRWARGLCRGYGKERAADIMAEDLKGEKTPDGVPYSRTTIRAALAGM